MQIIKFSIKNKIPSFKLEERERKENEEKMNELKIL